MGDEQAIRVSLALPMKDTTPVPVAFDPKEKNFRITLQFPEFAPLALADEKCFQYERACSCSFLVIAFLNFVRTPLLSEKVCVPKRE